MLAMVQGRMSEEEALRMQELEKKVAEREQEQALMQAYNEWRMEQNKAIWILHLKLPRL